MTAFLSNSVRVLWIGVHRRALWRRGLIRGEGVVGALVGASLIEHRKEGVLRVSETRAFVVLIVDADAQEFGVAAHLEVESAYLHRTTQEGVCSGESVECDG